MWWRIPAVRGGIEQGRPDDDENHPCNEQLTGSPRLPDRSEGEGESGDNCGGNSEWKLPVLFPSRLLAVLIAKVQSDKRKHSHEYRGDGRKPGGQTYGEC